MNPIAQEAIVGWLHDVVEDVGVTLEDIKNDFGSQVADAVDAITHRPAEAKTAYYARVKANPIGLTVKAADIADNTDHARLQLLEPDLRPISRPSTRMPAVSSESSSPADPKES